MTQQQEVETKLQQVRELLEDRDLAAAVLTTTANFAWLTGGGDNHVVTASEGGVGYIVVTHSGQHIITNNIEAPRLEDEEVGQLPFEIHYMNWHEENREAMLSQIVSGPVATDTSWPPEATNMAEEVARLRWQLLEPEIERYKQVGRVTAQALDETGHEIQPGMTEHEIGALLAGKLMAAGVTPGVLLIATDERVYKYRHPIPTDKPLTKYAMLVVGGSKWGLGISATRLVHFGELPAELVDKHAAVCQIDAAFTLETRPGAAVKDIFKKATEVYKETGYPDEWRLHHQGGATGYAPRDYKGGLESLHTVLEDQAFAWNPSIAGTKSEDTIIARADQTEIISQSQTWPMIEVNYEGQKIARPDILVR